MFVPFQNDYMLTFNFLNSSTNVQFIPFMKVFFLTHHLINTSSETLQSTL